MIGTIGLGMVLGLVDRAPLSERSAPGPTAALVGAAAALQVAAVIPKDAALSRRGQDIFSK
jgi:hypothetical protein